LDEVHLTIWNHMNEHGWEPGTPGVMPLPSGRLVRGRSLRSPLPAHQRPGYSLYLQGRRPEQPAWDSKWVKWRDFWLPADRDEFGSALRELLDRADHERVEIACSGGFGRTGTALACLAILDGTPSTAAVGYVREHYSHRAVETPWQRRFVAHFRP
jgi:hypothetical protein